MNSDLDISYLFENNSGTGGSRVDPYLWKEMKEHFSSTQMPSNLNEMEDLIERIFTKADEPRLEKLETIILSHNTSLCNKLWRICFEVIKEVRDDF